MTWTRLLKRYGFQVEEAGVSYDPFLVLATLAKSDPSAKVSITLGSSREYGEVKCAVTITLTCPQNETNLNMAAEVAFRKALELVNDGASQLGIPQLPPFEEPT